MNTSESLVQEIKQIINQAQTLAIRSVNFERVVMYWKIGQRIVEEEQGGDKRADYGQGIIKNLSMELSPEFGSGFSVRNLELMQSFMLCFQFRRQCLRNSVGVITRFSFPFMIRIKGVSI